LLDVRFAARCGLKAVIAQPSPVRVISVDFAISGEEVISEMPVYGGAMSPLAHSARARSQKPASRADDRQAERSLGSFDRKGQVPERLVCPRVWEARG
jgi:hypothetical protein